MLGASGHSIWAYFEETSGQECCGQYRSEDDGATWQKVAVVYPAPTSGSTRQEFTAAGDGRFACYGTADDPLVPHLLAVGRPALGGPVTSNAATIGTRALIRCRTRHDGVMSTATTPIGITGATGRLGGRIARRLAAAGVTQRLLVRDVARAPELAGATAVRSSYGDRDAAVAALTGLRTVLMVSGSESPDRVAQHLNFIDAAVEAGVEQIVYISFYGAAADCTFTLGRDHYATEQYLRGSGLTFTFLRDDLYADFLPQLVGQDGVIRGPAGNGRVAVVAQDDIADAATAVLLDPASHRGATYSLTGPESLSLAEVAEVLSEFEGRVVTYHDESVEEAYASRASYGAPDWQLDAWVSTYTAIAAGELAEVTNDIPQLTGHPATSVAELLRRGDRTAG